jgi:hypothetical protein
MKFFAISVFLAQTTPSPHFLEEPADQEVNPGDTADLKCQLNQPVTVIWLKDGRFSVCSSVVSQLITRDMRQTRFNPNNTCPTYSDSTLRSEKKNQLGPT